MDTFKTDVVLLDLVCFSKRPIEDQEKSISLLQAKCDEFIRLWVQPDSLGPHEPARFIPTGDGFYVVLVPVLVGYGVLLALSLRNRAYENSLGYEKGKEQFRIGEVRASVYRDEIKPFKDINGSLNFVGPGMTGAMRLLEAVCRRKRTIQTFYGDDYVTIVSAPLALETEKWLGSGYLDVIKWRKSRQFSIHDKHSIRHEAVFVDISRHVKFQPPSAGPRVDLAL